MVQFKKKNESDANPSLRLFDAEVGHFYPVRIDSMIISPHIVEISSLGAAQIDQFRLVGAKLSCCTAAFPIESRPYISVVK